MGKKKGLVRIKQVGPKAPALPINPMDAFQIPQEEMIRLPPPPDRKYQIFWPMHETFTMKITDFQVIYPSYIDSTKTIKMGRRISSEHAVPVPTVADISYALQTMQVRHVIQPYKGYSRDIVCQWENPGRIKVDVSRYKKKELLLEVVKIIPSIPERKARLEREASEKAKEEEERAATAAAAAAEATKKKPVLSTGSTKKQGKKGKRK